MVDLGELFPQSFAPNLTIVKHLKAWGQTLYKEDGIAFIRTE